MYLTLDEYENYLGETSQFSDEQFARLEYMARKHIDNLTHGRVKSDTTQREGVKRAMFDIINALNDNESARSQAGAGVASMSNDGVSVSFASVGAMDSDTQNRINASARLYLTDEVDADGTPLLFRGVYV